ncbi:DHH family phosphoesterase [Amycolatopsis sp. NPDC051071]|uniref:DHH family phosphoesterase n=1 Tax=Amycolatopsis sp. NPDC051071 TaxID=3154637 RepID=UPI0034285608
MTTTLAQDLRDAAALLASANDVTLLGHVRPDADALGSALALGRALQLRGGVKVRVSVGEPEEMPETLRGLDVGGLYVPASELPESEQLLVALDTPTPGRLGKLAPRVDAVRAAGGDVLVIDHHASNVFFGTKHVVDDTAEATAVLVFALLAELGTELDEPIARCLYAGLVTDTSGFRRARPSTHLMAAKLLEAGVDPDKVVREIVDDHPFAWLPMLSDVLSDARLEPDEAQGFGLAYAVVTLDAARTVRSEEVEAVVDVVRSTREAGVAVVLKEAEPTGPRRRWQVSLRSKGGVDVSAAAGELGGGGHRQAAGCTAEGTADEVLGKLKAALRRAPLL